MTSFPGGNFSKFNYFGFSKVRKSHVNRRNVDGMLKLVVVLLVPVEGLLRIAAQIRLRSLPDLLVIVVGRVREP